MFAPGAWMIVRSINVVEAHRVIFWRLDALLSAPATAI